MWNVALEIIAINENITKYCTNNDKTKQKMIETNSSELLYPNIFLIFSRMDNTHATILSNLG